jgi:hypothetical protein
LCFPEKNTYANPTLQSTISVPVPLPQISTQKDDVVVTKDLIDFKENIEDLGELYVVAEAAGVHAMTKLGNGSEPF